MKTVKEVEEIHELIQERNSCLEFYKKIALEEGYKYLWISSGYYVWTEEKVKHVKIDINSVKLIIHLRIEAIKEQLTKLGIVDG